MLAKLEGYKTYITAAVAIVGAVGGYLTGTITLDSALHAVLTAVLSMTIRHGISTGA